MDPLEFEDAIREDPENIDLRLVAADWYEEQGDARSEFIRLQLALSNLPRQHEWRADMQCREEKLLIENRARWNAPVYRWINSTPLKNQIHRRRALIRGWTYHRGFIEELSVDAVTFLRYRDILMHIGPIVSLKLWNSTLPSLNDIVQTQEFARITRLNLQHNRLGDQGIVRLLSLLNVTQLRTLNLTGNELTEAVVPHLERLNLANMERLVLSQNQIPQNALLRLHERFGDCIQHENGNPVYIWTSEVNKELSEGGEDRQFVSYDDDVLYEDGRPEREYESNSIDRYDGVEGLEGEAEVRPRELYGLFDDEKFPEEEEDRIGWDDAPEEPDWGSEDEDW